MCPQRPPLGHRSARFPRGLGPGTLPTPSGRVRDAGRAVLDGRRARYTTDKSFEPRDVFAGGAGPRPKFCRKHKVRFRQTSSLGTYPTGLFARAPLNIVGCRPAGEARHGALGPGAASRRPRAACRPGATAARGLGSAPCGMPVSSIGRSQFGARFVPNWAGRSIAESCA